MKRCVMTTVERICEEQMFKAEEEADMNETLIQGFRNKIISGNPVFGPFMKTCDPGFVEAAGYAGMDFAILDMEHGPVSIQSMQNNIRAAQVSGILPVVRVPAITEEAIGKALDIGAAAVEIPQISTAKEAELAVRLAKFAPRGERGVCRFVRAAHYSAMDRELYFQQANNTIVIAQIEGTEAVKNLDDILSVEGIDILFIGPYDLSQSLGVPGRTTHPHVIEEMNKIVKTAQEKGVVIGTFTDSRETMEMWLKAGVQYISYSVDMGIFYDSCQKLTKQFHEIATALE